DVTASAGLEDFADSHEVSKYSEAPMSWAVAQGIVVGEKTDSGVLLTPKATATRAQVATILMRFAGLE
ncbi:MAG: hypothetical protein MR473_06575, partial [Clostridiales bacterium]|nr:hypothetical protein [Clostridiales bacterium]